VRSLVSLSSRFSLLITSKLLVPSRTDAKSNMIIKDSGFLTTQLPATQYGLYGRFWEPQLSCTVHAVDGLFMHTVTLPTSYNHDAYSATAVGTHSRCLHKC